MIMGVRFTGTYCIVKTNWTSLVIQWLSPVVKTSPSNAEGVALIPGRAAKIHMPHG